MSDVNLHHSQTAMAGDTMGSGDRNVFCFSYVMANKQMFFTPYSTAHIASELHPRVEMCVL